MRIQATLVLSLISLSSAFSFPFLRRKSMTTASNIPKLDPDAYPEQPTGLSLEQVHVYVRHGERTPVGTRMNNPPANIPEHWPLCRGGRKFSAGILQATENKQALYSPGTIDIERVVEFRNGSSTSGICMLGELTDVGRGSTHDFGKALRKIYIERLGFLPDSTQDTSPVYYRSTNVPRTIESLQQIINGLYPNGKNLHRPQLLVRYVLPSSHRTRARSLQLVMMMFDAQRCCWSIGLPPSSLSADRKSVV